MMKINDKRSIQVKEIKEDKERVKSLRKKGKDIKQRVFVIKFKSIKEERRILFL